MPAYADGPKTTSFSSRALRGNTNWADLPDAGLSDGLIRFLEYAPRGACVLRGIPFRIGGKPVLVQEGGRSARVNLGRPAV